MHAFIKKFQIIIFIVKQLEDIVGQGENAGYQHFLLFPQCFQKASFTGCCLKSDCVIKG